MKRSLLAGLIFLLSVPSNAQVTTVVDSFFAPSISTVVRYTAVLPGDYSGGSGRYPVLYLLHGFGGDHTSWIKLTELSDVAEGHAVILVMPEGRNSWYTNFLTEPAEGWEDYLIRDLIPYIDRKYRTVPTRSHRAVAGLSMGGYGAAKLGLKYPSMFCYVGCLSGALHVPAGLEDSAALSRRSRESVWTLRRAFGTKRTDAWVENDVFSLVERASPKELPYFYLAVGSQDGMPEIITRTRDFATELNRRGIAYEFHETPGAHDWKLWNRHVKIVLKEAAQQFSKE